MERPVGRRWRWAITAAVVAALIAPVALDRDGFPLSTYPMYSRTRSSESTIVTAQGVDAEGAIVALTPTLIGDSDDPLIVVGELRAALAAGQGEGRCAAVAERVAQRSALVDVRTIEVVAERHDTVARTVGDDSLIERDVRVRCEVDRR